MDTYREIAQNYIRAIIPSTNFNLSAVCDDMSLLFPDFKADVEKMLETYNEINTDNDVPYPYETFRSHALQNIYYFRGSTKIRGGNILSAGMHHLGCGVDILNLHDTNGNKTKDKGEAVDWSNLNYTKLREISRDMGIHDLGGYEVCHFQFISTSEQKQLRITVYDEVKKFQRENGLTSDGIVGPKTIAKAKELYA